MSGTVRFFGGVVDVDCAIYEAANCKCASGKLLAEYKTLEYGTEKVERLCSTGLRDTRKELVRKEQDGTWK